MGKSIKQKLTTVSFLIKITNMPGGGGVLVLWGICQQVISGGAVLENGLN